MASHTEEELEPRHEEIMPQHEEIMPQHEEPHKEPAYRANVSASQGVEPVHKNKGKKLGGRCGRWASGGTLRFVICAMRSVQRGEEEKERVRLAGQPS